MPNQDIYFDNNATTQVAPCVLEAMLPWLQTAYGNPSSVYRAGRLARAAVDQARNQVADLLHASPEEIVFTSCGTESINTAILSACSLDPDKQQIITSAVEHSATGKLCDHLARRGYEIIRLGVNARGILDLEGLRDALSEDTAIVSLLWANNETGVLFPVEEIAALCAERKIILHLDAVQAVGKLPVDVSKLPGISFLSLSGHKLHAPKGVGALYVNRRVRFQPLLRGSQENTRRGGTENVASLVALGRAAELAASGIEEEQTLVRHLRDTFESSILEQASGVSVNGDCELRLPNTTNLSFDGIEAEGALILLDEAGIACSAGSACTSGSVTPSHVLQAMGMSNERARASLRFSFGRFNSEAEIQQSLPVILGIIEKLRRENPLGGSPVV